MKKIITHTATPVLLTMASQVSAETIELAIDVGPVGSSFSDIDLPNTALINLALDGSNLVFEIDFNRPLRFVADDPTLTSEGTNFFISLLRPRGSGSLISPSAINSGSLVDAGGVEVLLLDDPLVEDGLSRTDIGANLNDIRNQDGLIFQGIRVDIDLPDLGGTLTTGAVIGFVIEEPASFLVVPEPSGLALLGLGGLLVARRRR